MWWLIYRLDDKIVGIAIIEAPSLYHARMRAAVAGIGKAADFFEGKEIDVMHVGLIPREMIGRLLSPEQAIELKGRLTAADGDPVAESPPLTPAQEAATGSDRSDTGNHQAT